MIEKNVVALIMRISPLFDRVSLGFFLAVLTHTVLGSQCDVRGNFSARKSVYYIYGMPAGDSNGWLRQYKPTFEKYLDSVVGPLFSPPIQFKLIPTDTMGMFQAADMQMADFTFTSPNIFGSPSTRFSLARKSI